MTVDMGPATRRMAELIEQVPDDLLDGPTPCPAYTLGDLLDHVSGLARAFTAAARKSTPPGSTDRASGDASRLGDDWRGRLSRELDGLADAWRDPTAWTGATRAGAVVPSATVHVKFRIPDPEPHTSRHRRGPAVRPPPHVRLRYRRLETLAFR